MVRNVLFRLHWWINSRNCCCKFANLVDWVVISWQFRCFIYQILSSIISVFTSEHILYLLTAACIPTHSVHINVLSVWSPDTASSSFRTPPSSGASANEPTAQECCHGDEGGLPEATWADLSQDLHPASWQCQVLDSRGVLLEGLQCFDPGVTCCDVKVENRSRVK